MRILCKVDQAAALRQGIDAPSSTIEIEVDPPALSQGDRDLLATVAPDGYRAERKVPIDGGWSIPLPPLERPDLSGLLEALASLREAVAAETAEATERQANTRREAIHHCEEWLAKKPTEYTRMICLDHNGHMTEQQLAVVQDTATWYARGDDPWENYLEWVPEELRKHVEAEMAKERAECDRIQGEVLARLTKVDLPVELARRAAADRR